MNRETDRVDLTCKVDADAVNPKYVTLDITLEETAEHTDEDFPNKKTVCGQAAAVIMLHPLEDDGTPSEAVMQWFSGVTNGRERMELAMVLRKMADDLSPETKGMEPLAALLMDMASGERENNPFQPLEGVVQ